MLNIYFRYPRRMHDCVNKNRSYVKICRVCSGSCLSVWDVQVQIVLTILSGPEEETQFLNWSSPPPSEILCRRSCWVDDVWWSDDALPTGLSSCHLTHNLLLVMPGVFVDTAAWLLAQFLASTLQTATSFRLHDILYKKKQKTEENLLLSREKPTTWLSHCILEENMHKMTQISCVYNPKSTGDGGLRVTATS